ncbi:CDGSH iron-sulfur domain-containing protein 3, mitochondrial-like [Paramacrobiotus metropolitanus]|uniref:CDGSH iron-sulfur domain-containing protein 3, mitochondrial-like n=1 Tax=Paramacrobiotus metropolitanus TaxID=2943436 RepID=UPI0024464642|nr:CDGSH iron-sulfur domain-containing protein 3, mitochondrial-like [Paramacrobiotus metropolitanus]XP_055337178.1 CDGSH iron-sulfur domain-containing protein 3, mitochondrial-like [Paramacrobiotus metropolitanus]
MNASISSLFRGLQLCRPHLVPSRTSVRYYEYLEFEKVTSNNIPKEAVMQSKGAYQTEKGRIYDKKPFKCCLEPGKKYSWCSCGYSHKQPFCDGAHKKPYINSSLRPVKFVATEAKEVWFCNCKQTNTKPFCDKSCDLPLVQEARTN